MSSGLAGRSSLLGVSDREAPQASPGFVHVEVEPGPASADGLAMRWKRAGMRGAAGAAGAVERVVAALDYETEDGRAGSWHVRAAEDAEAAATHAARAVLVEDSSDGTAWLVVGGRHGLVLEHVDTGDRVWEPYLLLSRTTVFDR
jgi:hypothetical protein